MSLEIDALFIFYAFLLLLRSRLFFSFQAAKPPLTRPFLMFAAWVLPL